MTRPAARPFLRNSSSACRVRQARQTLQSLRGTVVCEGCGSPPLPALLAAREKPKIRLTCRLGKPVDLDIEVEFGKGKNETEERVVIHMRAPLAVEVIPATLAVRAQESAPGQPFARAVDGAKLTKADAARNAAAERSVAAVQRRSSLIGGGIPGGAVFCGRMRPPGLKAAPLVLVRNRDAGDLDGDGRENYTLDFMHWVPMSSVGSEGSLVLLKPEDSDVVALLFLSPPEVNGPEGCMSSSRAQVRCVYAVGRSPGGRTNRPGDAGVSVDGARWNAFKEGPFCVGTATQARFGVGMLNKISMNFLVSRRSQGETSGGRVGVSSRCIFGEKDCDLYETAMRVDGAERTIKTKSNPS